MDTSFTDPSQNLEGQFLIAMPSIGDNRFSRTVIYMCAHSNEGAMGLVINQQAEDISFKNLLSKLEIFGQIDASKLAIDTEAHPVHLGGPVATSRGFVLHSDDYFAKDNTLTIRDGICLTSTIDIIQAIADGEGPNQSITAIGYSGWGPGQLEYEIQNNGWLTCPANSNIIFENDIDRKYTEALSSMGIDPAFLASDHGHA